MAHVKYLEHLQKLGIYICTRQRPAKFCVRGESEQEQKASRIFPLPHSSLYLTFLPIYCTSQRFSLLHYTPMSLPTRPPSPVILPCPLPSLTCPLLFSSPPKWCHLQVDYAAILAVLPPPYCRVLTKTGNCSSERTLVKTWTNLTLQVLPAIGDWGGGEREREVSWMHCLIAILIVRHQGRGINHNKLLTLQIEAPSTKFPY